MSSWVKGGIIGAFILTSLNFLLWYGANQGFVPLMLYFYLSPMEFLDIEELPRNFVGSWYGNEVFWYAEMVLTDIVIGFALGAVVGFLRAKHWPSVQR